MKAVGFTRSLPVEDKNCLIEFEAPVPKPGPRDLLVKVSATSINPVDAKRRRYAATERELETPMILGFDAVGIVDQVGAKVEFFRPGDHVWYAGSIDRPGSNAEYQLVDERIAGHKPKSFNDAQAAALPLTAITAWQAIFDRLRVAENQQGSLLIIGGAGGVGSIAIQIAKQFTALNVIATASREASGKWCLSQGADYIADHSDLESSMQELGADTVDLIFNCADTAGYWDAMAKLIAPEGRIVSIVEASKPVDLTLLMIKSATFVWEMMMTRPVFGTKTLVRQHEFLGMLAGLADDGRITTTMTDSLNGLTAQTLIAAHRRIESGTSIGKLSINVRLKCCTDPRIWNLPSVLILINQ